MTPEGAAEESALRENCTSGSARGAPGNRRSYRGGEQPTRLRIWWGESPHTVNGPIRTVSISGAWGGHEPREARM